MKSYPEFFFVFANTLDVMCWHNLRFTESIVSSGIASAASDPAFLKLYVEGKANYAPFVPNDARSCGFISRFAISAVSHYQVEYDAEYVRFNEFGTRPSRLSAVYAFGTEDDCRKANVQYGWDLKQVKKFRLIDNPLTRVHRANMEIVSLMRSVHERASWAPEERDRIWRHYWSGGGSISVEIPVIPDDSPKRQQFESGEIWEYLIEGRLELVDA